MFLCSSRFIPNASCQGPLFRLPSSQKHTHKKATVFMKLKGKENFTLDTFLFFLFLRISPFLVWKSLSPCNYLNARCQGSCLSGGLSGSQNYSLHIVYNDKLQLECRGLSFLGSVIPPTRFHGDNNGRLLSRSSEAVLWGVKYLCFDSFLKHRRESEWTSSLN